MPSRETQLAVAESWLDSGPCPGLLPYVRQSSPIQLQKLGQLRLSSQDQLRVQRWEEGEKLWWEVWA